MPEATIVLRALREMGRRLVGEVSDDLCLVDHLYPKLLRYAGERRSAEGVAAMIRYTVPAAAAECTHGVNMADPEFLSGIVDAMIEDPAAAEEVKSYLFETTLEEAAS